ncbi:hypothetical protein ON010_g18697 [Phytophthora cinnamomi]|nr:hypothetical protein ON010_g18697 [Phytophthora cinnamomi]
MPPPLGAVIVLHQTVLVIAVALVNKTRAQRAARYTFQAARPILAVRVVDRKPLQLALHNVDVSSTLLQHLVDDAVVSKRFLPEVDVDGVRRVQADSREPLLVHALHGAVLISDELAVIGERDEGASVAHVPAHTAADGVVDSEGRAELAAAVGVEHLTVVSVVAVGPKVPARLAIHQREARRHQSDRRHVLAVHSSRRGLDALGDRDLEVATGDHAHMVLGRAGLRVPALEHGDVERRGERHVGAHAAVVAQDVAVEAEAHHLVGLDRLRMKRRDTEHQTVRTVSQSVSQLSR